jgi:hypothetical protein
MRAEVPVRTFAVVVTIAGCAMGCVVNSNQGPPPHASTTSAPGPIGPQPGQAQAPSPAHSSAASQPTGVAWPAPVRTPTRATIAIPEDGSWSLREREQWAQLARVTAAALNAVNDSCRAQVEGAFVFETFRGRFHPSNMYGIGRFDGDSYSAGEHARSPFIAIQQICDEGDMQRNAVRAKIRRIEIRFTGTGHSTFVLNGGVLTGLINPNGETESEYRAMMRGPFGLRRYL